MSFVTLFSLVKISINFSILRPGVLLPCVSTFVVLTILGLLGLINDLDFIATDLTITYYAYGLSFILIIIMFFLKFFVFGIDKKENKRTKKDKNIRLSIYKFYSLTVNNVEMVGFWIWNIVMIILFIGDFAFFHWFTTFDLSDFWYSILALIIGELLLLSIFCFVFFWTHYYKKIRILSEKSGVFEIIWYIIQLPLFNFAMWGAYQGFYHKLNKNQALSTLICISIFLAVNVIITTILFVAKKFYQNIYKTEENSYEKIEEENGENGENGESEMELVSESSSSSEE